jgi:hypothetical protein
MSFQGHERLLAPARNHLHAHGRRHRMRSRTGRLAKELKILAGAERKRHQLHPGLKLTIQLISPLISLMTVPLPLCPPHLPHHPM